MVILSNFVEALKMLMFDRGEMDGKTLAKSVGVAASTITEYLNARHIPTVENLVLLADYFNCSTDFLLGREQENSSLAFKKRPPFTEQIAFVAKRFEKSYKKFYEKANISENSFYEWKNGDSAPELESLLKIADCYDCRLDFILGREN